MKPFPHRNLNNEERIFNYRLSRARRVVENAFGILANRFRVFLSTVCLPAEKVENIVLSACCLHNFLLMRHPIPEEMVDREDDSHHMVPGNWREEKSCFQDIPPTQSKNYTTSAKRQRDILKLYFNHICKVPWQDEMI